MVRNFSLTLPLKSNVNLHLIRSNGGFNFFCPTPKMMFSIMRVQMYTPLMEFWSFCLWWSKNREISCGSRLELSSNLNKVLGSRHRGIRATALRSDDITTYSKVQHSTWTKYSTFIHEPWNSRPTFLCLTAFHIVYHRLWDEIKPSSTTQINTHVASHYNDDSHGEFIFPCSRKHFYRPIVEHVIRHLPETSAPPALTRTCSSASFH